MSIHGLMNWINQFIENISWTCQREGGCHDFQLYHELYLKLFLTKNCGLENFKYITQVTKPLS